MEYAKRQKLKIADRVAEQQARATIKKNPVLALVELITNSDDSYRRIENKGVKVSGKIVIDLTRKRKGSIIRVIDYAEGFNEHAMDEKVGSYGGDTSGFTEKDAGRGYWGRGLKEAMIAMGYGSVESIKDGYFHKCVLEKLEYRRHDPVKVTKNLRKALDVEANGTLVTLKAEHAGISIPYYENLKHSLEYYFSLRDIMANQNREIILIEKDAHGKIKKQEKLSYIFPKGELYTSKALKIAKYPKANIELEIYRAIDLLSGWEDEGQLRENGILIRSKGAILDITLTRKYEGSNYASRIYGHATSDYMDTLLRIEKEPIIRSDRVGIDWTHPFCKEIELLLSKEIALFVQEEEKKSKEIEKGIENEKTRKRYNAALPVLNKIANDELGPEEGGGEGRAPGKQPKLPPNGFDFIPEYVQIVVDKESTLTLKALIPKVISFGSKIKIESSDESITLLNNELQFNEKDVDLNTGLAIKHIRVIGKQAGAEGIITAKADGLKAEMLVKVISRRKIVEPPPDEPKRAGLFAGFEFSPSADPHQRVKYDRSTGRIVIATKAPSVEMYFGINGEGQEEGHCQVMLAELVIEAVCREIARRKIESGKEPYLGEASEAMNVVHNRLINKYAIKVHDMLVEPKYHR